MNRQKLYPFFALLILLVAFSCKDRVPSRYPDKKKMVEILVDVHIAESALANQRPSRNMGESMSNGMYKAILDKYGLTKTDFDSALVWYTSHPHIYLKIYDDVIARISDLDAQAASELSKQEEKDKLLAEKMSTKNLWNDSANYYYPHTDSANIHLFFKIKTDSIKLGQLRYSALYRFNKSDLKEKVELWMVANYNDSTRDTLKTEIVRSIPSKRTVATQEVMKDKYLVGMEIHLLKHNSKVDPKVEIDSIMLEYIPSQNIADYE